MNRAGANREASDSRSIKQHQVRMVGEIRYGLREEFSNQVPDRRLGFFRAQGCRIFRSVSFTQQGCDPFDSVLYAVQFDAQGLVVFFGELWHGCRFGVWPGRLRRAVPRESRIWEAFRSYPTRDCGSLLASRGVRRG
jgi:hypothetical protein